MNWNLNAACRFCYELTIILTLAVLALAPIHAKATLHFNITKIIDDRTVSFTTDRAVNIVPGDTFPAYRFNPDWTSPIGQLKVTAINGDEVICSFDPKKFSWPMGRQGIVTESNGSMVKVNIGSAFGLKPGDHLILFKERKSLGRIELKEVFDTYSNGILLNNISGDIIGLTASEFIIPTQAVIFKNNILVCIEILVFLLLILAHCFAFILQQRSLLTILGDIIRFGLHLVPQRTLFLGFNLLLGFPFVWFLVSFSLSSTSYLLNILIEKIHPLFSITLPEENCLTLLQKNIQWFYGLSTGTYLFILFKENKSPILLFWHKISFKTKNFFKPPFKDVIIWALHLVIAYVFGQSLFIILKNNTATFFALGWHNVEITYILEHFPRTNTLEDTFSMMRYFLWSITIIGCLFGYGHSIFGYLWGKRIRNVDFTLTGWIINAVCYQPLLSFPLWVLLPSFRGSDPTLTTGPLFFWALTIEFLLNLLYTLSIWNLGTMFGVMTDKGVRTNGFYNTVRHPSYTLEALMYLIIFLNGLSSSREWLTVLVIVIVYYIRSEREDQFMSTSNPEYPTYCKRATYKYIPGIY
ncbi:MAG: hypothetical protein HQL22_04820 [Candidatus Omnitrophica bacterium]|nr:hypothetical protein [Candidatus Omnitrophota bacterium]